MKKTMSFIMAFVMLVSFMGVATFAADDTVKVRRVTIYAPLKTVKVDRIITLEERIYPDDADYDEVEWDSSNYNIAEVDNYGEVTGISPGVATITVRVFLNNKRVASQSVDITVQGRADDGTIYGPGGTSTSPSSESSVTPSSSSKSGSSSATVSGEKISAAEVTSAVKANVKKGAVTSATFKGATSVSAASLQSAAIAMQNAGGTVLLNFDTINGKSVEGRLTINPASASNVTKDVRLGIYTNDEAVSKAKAKFEKAFSNKIAMIKASHSGNYGMTVSFTAKIGTALAKSKDLRLYSYNSDTGKYQEIKNSNISIDSKGYARFNTTVGGYLVVSDGVLA